MSIDVYLTLPEAQHATDNCIFIRQDGQNKEISRAEWDARYPGRAPHVVSVSYSGEVFSRNITHNLNKMAGEAGIYEAMWRPDEIGVTHAEQLIKPLTDGLALLKSDPERFKQFNPSNGWGDYDGLVDFVEDYLNACIKYRAAEVSVSR